MSVNYVEYLYGDNNSYIDTGIVVQSGYQIEVTFMSTEKALSMQKNDWSGIFGVGNLIGYSYDTAPYGISVGLYGSRICVKNDGVNKYDYLNIDGTCYNQKYTLSLTAGENVTNPANLFLFAVNFTRNAGQSNPYSWGYSCLRVYDFKIYNAQGTLIQHLKPCLNDNNVPCMYDEVSGEYFENLGAGTFGYEGYHLYLFADNNENTAENLGSYRLYNMKIDGDSEGVESGVNYVDCLMGDGNSWIDTGIVVRSGYTIDLTFMSTIPSHTGQVAICGSGDVVGYGYDRYGGYGIGLGTYFVTVREIRDENNIDKNYLLSTNVKFTENKKTNFSHKFTNVNNNGSCIVMGQNFCNNGNNTSINYKTPNTVKLYDFKIYNDSNTLLIHLRPCLDEEGVPCMYDEVSKQYFHNQGTGTFGYKTELRDFQPVLDSNNTPCLMDKINKKYYYSKNGNGFKYNGYTRVGYLEGVANRYINTNIIPTMNTRVEVDISPTSYFTYAFVFGSDTFMQFQYQTTNQWLHISKKGVTHSIGDGATRFEKCKIIMDMTDTTNLATINGTNWGNNTGTTTSTGCPIVLFSGYDQWGGVKLNEMGQIRIHSFKIYESNELIFDGIPVLDNEGTPCMYDLVTETFFYGERGDGEFSYGAVEELECPPVDYVGYIKNPQTEGVYNEFIKVPNMLFNETWKKIKAKYYTCTNGTSRLWEIYNGRFSLATNYGAFLFSYTNENGENKTLELFRNVGIAPDNNTMMYFDVEWTPGNFNINGMNQTYEEIAQPQSSGGGRELRLCGNRMKGGIQYFTVYGENDVILLDLHACVDDNGVTCVYDTIAKDFIYPVGTNPFTAEDGIIGYTPIKYIETNGTQYIDTGVVVNDNTDIDIVARACESKTIVFDYCYTGDGHYYTPKFPCNEVNNAITNNSDHSIVVDYYGDNGAWKWQTEIKSGATENLSQHSYVAVRFTAKDQINYVNDYIFIQGEQSYSSKPGNTDLVISLQDCMSIGYLMNDLIIGGTYKFKETNTNVEPNLTASAGATLTLGSTYSAFLTETEIEQAINNGWTIE